jgi:hypothetical protein
MYQTATYRNWLLRRLWTGLACFLLLNSVSFNDPGSPDLGVSKEGVYRENLLTLLVGLVSDSITDKEKQHGQGGSNLIPDFCKDSVCDEQLHCHVMSNQQTAILPVFTDAEHFAAKEVYKKVPTPPPQLS